MPRVRAVLALHAERHGAALQDVVAPRPAAPLDAHPDAPMPAPATRTDPNALLPVQSLADALQAQASQASDPVAHLRMLGTDYVQLWARTFKGLVRHLRGRPERALSLLAAEVYPYLRGDRLAARVEDVGPGRARLVLATDLPDAYLEGMVAAFVGLSGAKVVARMEGATCHLSWTLGGLDRVARGAQVLAALRIPLVVAAMLSVATGILLSLAMGHPLQVVRGVLLLVGALAAQAAANAWHDMQSPHPAGPLGPVRPGIRLMQWTVWLGYPVAGAIGLGLAVGHLWVLVFAAAGLVVSALFGKFRDHGLGPLLAGLTYGPLLPLGVVVALGPVHLDDLALLRFTLPLGLLAAAMLYVDDLADRPLDEAGGQRTLIVRLAPRNRLVGYAALLVAALLTLAASDLAALRRNGFLMGTLAIVAGLLVWHVRSNLEEPRRLAPARFGTFMLLMATAALAMDALGGLP